MWSVEALFLLSIVAAAALLLTNQWPWAAVPRDAPTLNNRGVELACRGDLEQALDDFSRAIQLGPPRAEYYNNRGVMYASRSELELASADFDESLRVDPEFAAAIANRAITRARQGQVELVLCHSLILGLGGWGRASARPQLFAAGGSLRSTPATPIFWL